MFWWCTFSGDAACGGADPWVATALALLFALLGAGAEDLAWAFQIGFVSSVLFGLLSMEVAEGPPSAGDAPFPLPPSTARLLGEM